MLFSFLLHSVAITCSKIVFKTALVQCTALFFLRFWHYLVKNIINCVMKNKMASNERMCPVKHNHTIQGIFLLLFLMLNEYLIICVSFAVKYM